MNLTAEQLDSLKEISNIGMGHAATALSQLVGEDFDLQVPRVNLVEISRVPEMIGGAEKVVVGITLQVLGAARGNILIIFPRESAKRLLTALLGPQKGGLVLDDLGASSLREVGNIVASAYLSALGNLLKTTFIPSVPMLAYDMAGAVVDHVLIQLSQDGDTALLMETDFQARNSQKAIRGHFLLMPDAASLDVILNLLARRP